MTKSFLRTLLAALGAAALFGTATTASAAGATLTFNDPNCASFSITGGAGSFTLVCGSLTCTATANPTSPLPGGPSALTGNCTGGGAVTYAWSVVGAGCPAAPAGNVASGNVTSAVAVGPCVYKVTGTDPTLLSGTATASVTWTTSPPAAPSGCTLAAVPGSLPVGGGNVTFTAACTGGGAPTSHAWTGAGVVTPTVPGSQIVNVTASGTYTVTPSNSGGNGNMASASVTVAGGGVTCSGFTKTVYVDMGWPPYSSLHTQDYGSPAGFGGTDALVIHIKPPAGSTSPPNTSGSLKLYEYAGPTADRFAVLSTSACDFVGVSGWLDANKIPLLVSLPAGNPNSTILLNLIQVNRQDSTGYVKLLPGVDYYLNIKNTKPDGVTSTCSGSNCNMIIEWTPPPGT